MLKAYSIDWNMISGLYPKIGVIKSKNVGTKFKDEPYVNWKIIPIAQPFPLKNDF